MQRHSRGRLRWVWIGVAAGLALAAVALAVWGRPLLAFFDDRERVADLARRWGRWAPAVTIGLHVAQVLAAPIPGQALDAVNGFLFGPWLGTLYSMIGLGTGSTLAMGLARRWGRPLVERVVDAQTLARLDGLVRRHGAAVVFLVFLLPFLPDDAVCFVAGLTTLPLLELIVLALVGRLPGVFVANWIGAHALDLSPAGWGALLAAMLVTGALFWGFQSRIERALDVSQRALLSLAGRCAERWRRWRGKERR